MTTLTVPGEQPELLGLAVGRGSHRISFEAHGTVQITLHRQAGTAAVAVTADGTAPNTPGPWRWVLAAGEHTLVVPVPVADTAVVRLHAEGDVTLDVRPF